MGALRGCVFCEKIAHSISKYASRDVVDEPDLMLQHDSSVFSFVPLNPVAPGHRLFVPTEHLTDAADDPHVTARVMFYAALWVKERVWPMRPANIITSIGTAASQSVMHLHIHVVPRFEGDGLKLPWTDQHGR